MPLLAAVLLLLSSSSAPGRPPTARRCAGAGRPPLLLARRRAASRRCPRPSSLATATHPSPAKSSAANASWAMMSSAFCESPLAFTPHAGEGVARPLPPPAGLHLVGDAHARVRDRRRAPRAARRRRARGRPEGAAGARRLALALEPLLEALQPGVRDDPGRHRPCRPARRRVPPGARRLLGAAAAAARTLPRAAPPRRASGGARACPLSLPPPPPSTRARRSLPPFSSSPPPPPQHIPPRLPPAIAPQPNSLACTDAAAAPPFGRSPRLARAPHRPAGRPPAEIDGPVAIDPSMAGRSGCRRPRDRPIDRWMNRSTTAVRPLL